MATPAQILNLAQAGGSNHCNLGVGKNGAGNHVDISPTNLYNGYTDGSYFYSRTDNTAVVFRVNVTGGRTSRNTKYPRVELREVNVTSTSSSTVLADWDVASGTTHWMRGKTRFIHLPKMKPWGCFGQIHNGGSDVVRLQTEGSTDNLQLVCRHTPKGSAEVRTVIQSSYTLGDVIDWKIEVIGTTLKVYIGGQVKYTGSVASYTGCYFKAGLYLQSSVNEVNDTEGGDTSQYGQLELFDFMTWHTGYTTPAATYYEVNGGGSSGGGGGGGGSTTPTIPSDIITLSKWYLTLPTGSTNNPDDIYAGATPDLKSYSGNYFKVAQDANGYHVLFESPVNGPGIVTTSAESGASRSELREMGSDNGGTNGPKAAWSFTDGKSHSLTVTMSVDPTSISGSNARKETIIGQIHGAGGTPPLYLSANFNGTPFIGVFKNGPSVGSILSGITATTKFTYRIIKTSGNRLQLFYALGDASALPSTPQFDWPASDFSDSDLYFKVGAYNKTPLSNSSASGSSKVRVYAMILDGVAGPTQGGGTGQAVPTTVNAGADASVTVNTAFARTATEAGTATITSRKWTIVAAPSTGGLDNTQAAHRQGWGDPLSSWSDEFTAGATPVAPNSTRWGRYSGAGHAGNGTRDPDRIMVANNVLTIEGLESGSTGGMESKFNQQYGKWEVRARSYPTAASNGHDYHPVLEIWPQTEKWPDDGEYCFSENGKPGDTKYQAYIHFPHSSTVSVQQRQFVKTGVDLTLYHNFAIEWTKDYIRGYFDGEMVFETTGGANADRRDIQTMPSGHLTMQLDNFDGTDQSPAKFDIDWVKIYPDVPTGTGPSGSSAVGTQIGTAAALSWTPTVKGAYTLRYTVTTSQGSFFDDVVVNVGDGTPTGPATTADLGKNTDGTGASASSTDKLALSPFTSGNDRGTLTVGHARVWVDSGTTTAKVYVYADNAGVPGAVLAISDEVTISNTAEAQVNFPFPDAQQILIEKATAYWVGLGWKDPGTVNINYSRGTTAGGRQELTPYTYPTPPAAEATLTAQSGPLDVWVTYNIIAPTLTPPSFVTIAGKSGLSAAVSMGESGASSGDMDAVLILSAGAETMTAIPAGWQLMDMIQGTGPTGAGGGPYTAWLYFNTAGNSGAAAWTKSGTRFWHAIRGVWKNFTSLGQHQVRAETSGSGTISHTTPPVSTVNPKSMIVAMCVQDLLELDPGPYNEPPNWTERYDVTKANVNEREAITVADIVVDTPGQVLGTFVGSNSDEAVLFAFVLEGPPATGDVDPGDGGTDPGETGDPSAPRVDAGEDVTVGVNADFFRIATVEDNGAAITSSSWIVSSGPGQVGQIMSTTRTVTYQFKLPGEYVVTFAATNALGTSTDSVKITVSDVAGATNSVGRTSGWFALHP